MPEGFSGSKQMCNLQVGVTPGGVRLPSKTTFLKDVTAGYSLSLPILGRELKFIAEKNMPILFICVGR